MELNGINLYYEIHGEGKELVLLHGWGASVESFRPVIDYFSKQFKVISLDFPGFGKTSAPESVWGVCEYAELVKSFLTKLSINDPILLGHSFGGRIIIYLIGNKKISAQKVILVDSAGIKPKRKLLYFIKIYSFKAIKKLLQFPIWKKKSQPLIEKARRVFGSGDYKSSSGILREIMVKVVNEDLTKLLRSMEASTLIIWGENDMATPLSDGKLMERLIPDAGLVVLKGTGHFSYLEKNREFNTIVEHFLKN